MGDASLLQHLFLEQGFVVLPSAVPAQIKLACFDLAQRADQRGGWIKGDESDHAWDELSLDPGLDVSSLVHGLDLLHLVPVKRSTQWINRYVGCAFIPEHKDAAGDAHLLLVIEQSEVSCGGGQLWIGEEARVIPMGEGDAILFPAAKVVHGMTPMDASVGAKRMTLNARLWVG